MIKPHTLLVFSPGKWPWGNRCPRGKQRSAGSVEKVPRDIKNDGRGPRFSQWIDDLRDDESASKSLWPAEMRNTSCDHEIRRRIAELLQHFSVRQPFLFRAVNDGIQLESAKMRESAFPLFLSRRVVRAEQHVERAAVFVTREQACELVQG